MASQFIAGLHPVVPQIRLVRYRTIPPCDLHMLTNYFWNIALSEALHSSLHGVELALRNTIHATLTTRAGRPDWWTGRYTISPASLARLDTVRDGYLRDYRIPIANDRLVSGLDFGFWVTMLSGKQSQWIWQDKRHNWLDLAFPYRNGLPIADIHSRFNEIRKLRNRAMHHECIFDRPNLRIEHLDIHEAIQWISPNLHAGIHVVDSFPEVFQHGWERAYVKLHGLLGGP